MLNTLRRLRGLLGLSSRPQRPHCRASKQVGPTVLHCDLPHPHPGEHHFDEVFNLRWSVDDTLEARRALHR